MNVDDGRIGVEHAPDAVAGDVGAHCESGATSVVPGPPMEHQRQRERNGRASQPSALSLSRGSGRTR